MYKNKQSETYKNVNLMKWIKNGYINITNDID